MAVFYKTSTKDKISKAPGPALLLNQHAFLREHELWVFSWAMLLSLAPMPLHLPLVYPFLIFSTQTSGFQLHEQSSKACGDQMFLYPISEKFIPHQTKIL